MLFFACITSDLYDVELIVWLRKSDLGMCKMMALVNRKEKLVLDFIGYY